MKKGFTLIELLAVILILGIIALIAIPTVSNSIKEAKVASGKVSVNELVKSVEAKKVENDITNKSNLEAGYYVKNDLEKLNISGIKSFDNILVEFSADGSISSGTFCVNGLSYSYDGEKAIYQEYADFCNGKIRENSSGLKLITGGFILDAEGNLYAVGIHNNLKYYDGSLGGFGSSVYKKVNTNGVKFKYLDSNGEGEYAGISMDNKLYTWGYGGVLGLIDKYWVPVNEPTLVSDSIEFKEVVLGHYNGIGIDTSGQLWTWGYSCPGFEESKILVPTPRKILEGVNIVSIVAASYQVSLALDDAGDMYIWGSDESSFAGNNTNGVNYATPTKVLTGYNFKKMYSGSINKGSSYGTIYAIDDDANLWAWGENSNGQIKEYDGQFVLSPYMITDNVKKIAANSNADYLAVIKNDNSLYLFNARKKISTGLLKYQDNVKDVGSFSNVIYYLDMDNNIYSFGSSTDGALGIGISNYYNTPTKVNVKLNSLASGYVVKNNELYKDLNYSKYENIKEVSNINSIFEYGHSPYLLYNDGTIEELECYSRTLCDWFKNALASKKFKYVNYDSSAALLIDFSGNLYSTGTWQFNNNLGYAANSGYYYYNQLLSGKKFKKATVGSSGLALTTDNVLYGWGDNYKGKLGNGNETDQVTPIKIAENVLDYYNDLLGIYIIDTNNNLYYSGHNYIAGSTTTFKKFETDIKFSKIYSDDMFGDINGYIYGYGYNHNGNFGIGNVPIVDNFTKLLGGKKVRDVKKFGVSYYLTENNELYVAGTSSGYANMLGLGNNTNRQDTYTLLMKDVDSITSSSPNGVLSSDLTIIINTLSGDSYMLGDNRWEKDVVTITKPVLINLYD